MCIIYLCTSLYISHATCAHTLPHGMCIHGSTAIQRETLSCILILFVDMRVRSEHIWAYLSLMWSNVHPVSSTDYRHKRTQQPTQECSQKKLPAKLSLVFDTQWIGVFDLDWIGDRCESWIHRKRLFPKLVLVVSSRFRSCLFSLFWQICRLWHAVLLTVTDEAWHPPQLSQKGFST